eukprot:g13829.t1
MVGSQGVELAKMKTTPETRVALVGALKAAGMEDDVAEEAIGGEEEPEIQVQTWSEKIFENLLMLGFVVVLGAAVGGVNVLFHKMVLYGGKAVDAFGVLLDPGERAGFIFYKITVAALGSTIVNSDGFFHSSHSSGNRFDKRKRERERAAPGVHSYSFIAQGKGAMSE